MVLPILKVVFLLNHIVHLKSCIFFEDVLASLVIKNSSCVRNTSCLTFCDATQNNTLWNISLMLKT